MLEMQLVVSLGQQLATFLSETKIETVIIKHKDGQMFLVSSSLTISLAASDISSHSGLTNSYLPFIILRNMMSCFLCQNGGKPANLQYTLYYYLNYNNIIYLQSVHNNTTGPSKERQEYVNIDFHVINIHIYMYMYMYTGVLYGDIIWGYVYWDIIWGYVYWDIIWRCYIEICILGYVYWDMHIGICILGYVYWDMYYEICILGYVY